MLDVQASPDPALRSLLSKHPRVGSITDLAGEPKLRWHQGNVVRTIFVGQEAAPQTGVVELMDNNPLVCTDSFSLPSPAGTLAVLALGPLAEAGLIVERPTMLVSVDESEEDIAPYLASLGWTDGLLVAADPKDLKGAIAATIICAVVTPDRLEDIDDLFEERYGRSFFVRRDETSEWDVSLVIGNPHAIYRIRISPDEPHSLLTVQIMADINGKCGAAQIVHAMNVMCGFEESLGLTT